MAAVVTSYEKDRFLQSSNNVKKQRDSQEDDLAVDIWSVGEG